MKRVIFFLLLAVSFSAQSQTLKELLYSGKLKNDSNTVVRKTDDLSTKIDTAQKKKPEPVQQKVVASAAVTDTIKKTNPQTATVSSVTGEDLDTVRMTISNTVEAPIPPPPPPAAPTKTTTRIWKEYTDSLVKVLQAEVMSNKKNQERNLLRHC